MKLEVFSVMDKCVMAYLQPYFCRSKGEAVRAFTEAVNNKEHQFHKHMSDYYLVYLGEFDDRSGLFVSHEPVRIISATECVIDDVFVPSREERAGNGAGRHAE